MRWWKPLLFGVLVMAIQVIPGISQEEDDHGNEPNALSATFLTDTRNLQFEGALEEVGDTDCFMFESGAGNNFTISVTEVSNSLDPLLLLLDRDSASILGIQDSTNDQLASIDFSAPAAGFYYFCLRNSVATQGTGTYSVQVTGNFTGTPNTTPGTGTGTTQPPGTQNPTGTPTPTPVPTVPTQQPPTSSVSIALVSGDDTTSTEDVQSYLLASGRFSSVDILDATSSTPSLSDLSNYQAALVWADNGFDDPAALGNVLADYVDQGGGVIVAAVSFDSNSPFDPDAVEGRFADQDYYVIQPGTDNTDEDRRSLGQVNDPSHPIMSGIEAIDGGPRSFHSPTSAVTSGGSVVASWDNGDVLVAVKTIGQTRRADLNIFPPSGRVDTDLWPFRPSNQVPELFTNALLWVAGQT